MCGSDDDEHGSRCGSDDDDEDGSHCVVVTMMRMLVGVW